MNIVIIDDDTAFLRSLELILKSRGYSVRTFSKAAEAYSTILLMKNVDVVISDYSMPDVDGCSVLRAIRHFRGITCKTILLSAHSDILHTCSSRGCSVDYFLTKPVDVDALINVVNSSGGIK
jgi:DNA-binding response OmpR family regulator